MGHQLDSARFTRHVGRLVATWTWPLDAIILVLGKATDDAKEYKEQAMHHWLLGFQFHETVIVLLKNGRVIFLSNSKKIAILKQLTTGVTLMVRKGGKAGEPDVDPEQMQELLAEIREGKEQVAIGELTKSIHIGPFAEAFAREMSKLDCVQISDCKEELSKVLAPKDEEEMRLVKNAALCAVHVMRESLMKRLEGVIDQDLNQTNRNLCSQVQQELEGEDMQRMLDVQYKLDSEEFDPVLVSLQSGKSFSLRIETEPDDEIIPMQGTYLLFMAAKYVEYSACIARTILVDPTRMQKEAYHLAVDLHAQVVAALKPGAVFKDIYLNAKAEVQRRHEPLLEFFAKNVGWGMGLELRDTQLPISDKCEREVVPGMVVCVSVGFCASNAAAGAAPPWAVWVADTVTVPMAGGGPEVLTAACGADPKYVMYELAADEEPPSTSLPAALPPPALHLPPAQKAAQAPVAKGKPKAKAKAASSENASAAKAKAKPRGAAAPPAATRPTRSSAAAAAPAARSTRAPAANSASRAPAGGDKAGGRTLRARTAQTKADMSRLAQIEEKQKELRTKKFEEIKERFANGAVRGANQSGPRKLDHYKAYGSPAEFPAVPDAKPIKLQMDLEAEALLVPVNGGLVPFHVSTVKNMSRSTLDRFQVLRVNFFTPGNGKTLDDFPSLTPTRVFVKELVFRAEQRENLDAVARNFKEAQKRLRQKELENDTPSGRKSTVPTCATTPLQLMRPFPCLRDLNVRPTLATGSRRCVGTIEAHANGFRFAVKGSNERVDILYAQIKHAVFEPCASGSLIVLLHFHLHEPIMVGKKRTLDIQFFTEVGVQVDDLSHRRAGSAYDPDEILEEQNERLMKERLNTLFRDFCKQVDKVPSCPLDFDIPIEDFAFSGVPAKSQINLCFGKSVLVGLQEWPPVCISLDDVDFVVFERANMMLREFDVVFVKKNYDELPIRITTIPKAHFDKIRFYLAQKDLTWYSSNMNLQWAAVMKQVSSDPEGFVEMGGWDAWFVGTGAGSDSEQDEGQESSDFVGEDEDEDDDDNEVVEDEEGSEFSEADEDDDDDDMAEDDEDGLSWDELEVRADKSDRKRERSKSRDRGAAGGGRQRQNGRPKRARR